MGPTGKDRDHLPAGLMPLQHARGLLRGLAEVDVLPLPGAQSSGGDITDLRIGDGDVQPFRRAGGRPGLLHGERVAVAGPDHAIGQIKPAAVEPGHLLDLGG